MSDTLPPLSALEQIQQYKEQRERDFENLMALLPGMSQGAMKVLFQAHEHMNTPGARGGNLISLPAPGVAEGGGDE